MSTDTNRSMFTLLEIARRAELSRATLYRLIADGNGPRLTKFGRAVRVTIEAETEWRQSLDGRAVEITA